MNLHLLPSVFSKYLAWLLSPLLFTVNTTLAQETTISFSDIHNSSLYRLYSTGDFSSWGDSSQTVNLLDLRKLNTQWLLLSLGVPRYGEKGPQHFTAAKALAFFRDFKAYCATHFPEMAFVKTKAELELALANGKMACSFALEDSYLLENQVHYLDSLRDEGLCMIGIAHWFCNSFLYTPGKKEASRMGLATLNEKSKLSPSGKQLLKKAIALGILVDLSHMRERMFAQVARLCKGKTALYASHANAWELCKVPRNLKNPQLEQIKKSGGKVGVCFHQAIISEKEAANVHTLAQHIAYLVKILGEDSVCLGSDYEGNIKAAEGLEQVKDLPNLFKALQQQGLSELQIKKIMSSNALQLLN